VKTDAKTLYRKGTSSNTISAYSVCLAPRSVLLAYRAGGRTLSQRLNERWDLRIMIQYVVQEPTMLLSVVKIGRA